MQYDEVASRTVCELREFAGFTAAEQRYIARSLDVARERGDALGRWARCGDEAIAICEQHVAYRPLPALREAIPERDDPHSFDAFVGPLLGIAAFDLAQGGLASFAAFRFLYERLLGSRARPWLTGTFCAAAMLPWVEPERRRRLLGSLGEPEALANVWCAREPAFFPGWIGDDPD